MGRLWKVAIVKDTSRPMLGLHGLHAACLGLPDVEAVALVDANPADLPHKLAACGARRHYAGCSEMLAREHPDIVVLCSRHPADHIPLIKAAAAHGCHVYCEKPMTADLREADAIVELARTSGIRIAVAHPARHALAFLTLKRLVAEGAIGTPLTVHGRGKCDHRGGGEDLIVLGTHILDLQAFLFGAPCRVWAEVRTEGRPIGRQDRNRTAEPVGPTAGDDCYACFSFAHGVRGIFESRRGLPGVAEGVVQMGVTVAGTHGALDLRFNDAATPACPLRITRRPGPPGPFADFEDVPLAETRTIPGAQPLDLTLCGTPDIPWAPFFMEANRFALWDLIQAIKDNRPPACNATHARTALEMIYGIYASSLAGRAIDLPLADRTHPLEA